MIDRYQTREMSTIWSLEAMYNDWWRLELAVVRAWEIIGTIPKGTADELEAKVRLSVDGILDVERKEPHDLNAFLIFVGQHAPKLSRWLHRGLTSSDIKDTAFLMQMRQSMRELVQQSKTLHANLLVKARAYTNLVCVSRTHGQHAEPTTYGLRFLNWAEGVRRATNGLSSMTSDLAIGKFSGPTGQYSVITPEVETIACETLGIRPIGIATQIIPRDIIASAMNAVVMLTCVIEKIAMDIRNLSRSEIREVQEGSPHTSSVMAHKKNPSSSETICGLARLVRSMYATLLEDVATWEERDMTQSSVERVVIPDMFHAVHYLTKRMASVVSNLVVDTDRIGVVLGSTFDTVFSQQAVLALESAGMERDAARKAVERLSRITLDLGTSLLDLLYTDSETAPILDGQPRVSKESVCSAITRESQRMLGNPPTCS